MSDREYRSNDLLRISTWLFLLLAFFHIGVTRGHFVGTDEVNVYQTTRSLYERGDFSTGATRNTKPGREGLQYSVYNSGLAILAVPLYAAGKGLHTMLDAVGQEEWAGRLAGPPSGREPWFFGGELEIFFVNLTNAFLTALLCVVFFRISILLGANAAVSVWASIVLGTATYVAPFSIGLLRHTSEALFMLGAIYMMIRDAKQPSTASKVWAGVMIGLLLQVRLASIICLPGLLGYVLYHAIVRTRDITAAGARMRAIAVELTPTAVPMLVSLAFYFWVNWIKFGSALGHYGDDIQSRFETPLLYGLNAFLLSPGASIFVFTPLLLLTPLVLRRAYRDWPSEMLMIGAVGLSYLYFYSTFTDWSGLPTALGPRYMMAVVPLLLLPFGLWWQEQEGAARKVVWLLIVVGFCVQLVHVAVNFGFVYHEQAYPRWNPPEGFMFSWKYSPLLAHFRSLFYSQHLIDMWLVTMARLHGLGTMALVLTPIALAAIGCGVRLTRLVRSLESEDGVGQVSNAGGESES
ncbi:MAG: hypothetical protein ACI8W3_000687 [Myxococcota bacterium]|jgi:hypothetical protein